MDHRLRPSVGDVPAAAPAHGAVAHMVKARARLFARRPQALEALHAGLGTASPAALCAIAEHLVARETSAPRRWFGFGGEVTLLNARAALLLGRTLRRSEVLRPETV